MPTDPGRTIARLLRAMARLGMGTAIVLSPWRGGILLAARPMPPIYAGYTDVVATWSDIAIATTLALWLLSLALEPRRVSLGPAFLRWPAAGLLLAVGVGIPWSIDPALSLARAGETLLAAAFAVYVLNEAGSIRRLAAPLAAMVAIQAVVAIGQVVAQRSLGLSALGELPLDPRTTGVSVAAAGADRLLRAYGLADHPNILGGLLAFALLLLGAGLVGRRGPGLAAGWVVCAAGLLALLLTFSRAAWLAAAAGITLALAMEAARRDRDAVRRWAAAGAGAALLFVLVLIPLGRFVEVRTDVVHPTAVTEVMSLGERSILVQATSAVFTAHPLAGTGLATLPIALLRTQPALTFDYQPASVVVLDVAAEVGAFAALCYAILLAAPLLGLWRTRRRWTADLAAASAALLAVTMVGFFDYYTWTFPAGRLWAWLVLSLWALAYSQAVATSDPA